MLRANKIAAVVTLSFIAYYVLSLGTLVLALSGPDWAEFAALIFAIPALYLVDLLKPLLNSLGMYQRSYFMPSPTEGGYLLALILYSVVIYALSLSVTNAVVSPNSGRSAHSDQQMPNTGSSE